MLLGVSSSVWRDRNARLAKFPTVPLVQMVIFTILSMESSCVLSMTCKYRSISSDLFKDVAPVTASFRTSGVCSQYILHLGSGTYPESNKIARNACNASAVMSKLGLSFWCAYLQLMSTIKFTISLSKKYSNREDGDL